jgi:hypothetical protein
METPVSIEVQTNPPIDIPRLTYDRVFAPENDLPENTMIKSGIVDELNDTIAASPESVLEDLEWLGAQLDAGEPIETLPFHVIKSGTADDAWAAQRPHIDLIRNVLSITSNGSQFAFGETPQLSDIGFAAVYAKNNEDDREGIAAAQRRVHVTQNHLRAARLDKTTPEVDLAYWDQQHTIAKQQRALMRLRAIALIARGPQEDTPDTVDTAQPDTGEVAHRSAAARTLYRVREAVGSALMALTL